MSTTRTASQANTFSEARARDVMQHVLGDFMAAASAGLILRETIQTWHEEVEYAVLLEVVDAFQLQFTKPDKTRVAICYTVKDDGSILEASKAGGIDFHALPSGTRPAIVITYRRNAKNLDKLREYLRTRGWTTEATLVEGTASRDRAFSKSGFGIERGTLGEW